MADNRLVGGLIAVVFLLVGTIYFYPTYVSTDYCYVGGSYGLWEPTGEHIYFNDSFPAIGRYWCAKEAKVTKEECAVVDKMLNPDGCKWGGKLSTSKKMLYVMEDPEIPVTTTISDIKPLISTAIDVGLDKTKGISLNLIENGLTHKVLEIIISEDILAQDLSILFTENNVEMTRGTLTKKEVSIEYYDTFKDNCTSKEIYDMNNDTTYTKTTCVKVFDRQLSREIINWVPLTLKVESTKELDKLTTFAILEKGTYRFAFDVPVIKTKGGWGNAGNMYIKVNDTLYTDKQNSSWWNTTWLKRMPIIEHNNGTVTKINSVERACVNLPNNNVRECSIEFRLTECSVSGNSCEDIEQTEIPYYVYYNTSSGSYCNQACFNFKVNNLTSGTNRTLYLYFNNSNAPAPTSTGKIYAWDNFENGSKDTSIWGQGRPAGNFTIVNHRYRIEGDISDSKYDLNVIYPKYANFSLPFVAETDFLLMGNVAQSTGGILYSCPSPAADANPWYYYFNAAANQYWNGVTEGAVSYPSGIPNTNTANQTVRIAMSINDTKYGFWNQNVAYYETARTYSDRAISFGLRESTSAVFADFDNIIVYEGEKNNIAYNIYNQSLIEYIGAEEGENQPSNIGYINCTNGTSYKNNSFVWNEPTISCQASCNDDTAVIYVNFSGTEGVSAFDSDTNDTWFNNITNYTGTGIYSITVPSYSNIMNYSGIWSVYATCSDGSLFSSASASWTIPNGNVNVTLLYPTTNISRQNGTYILNVQARKGCVGGECFNTSQYFTIGV